GEALRDDLVPIDLTLTATLLNGRAQAQTDDFGNSVPDITHRARFHFVRGPEAREGRDVFQEKDIGEWLALASRATASFPGAFEATFCPAQPESARATNRANMNGFLEDIEVDR